MLRFATAGSVDDGKSTLIGRLLFDTKKIFDDQLESLRISSKKRGSDGLDLSLLTDGLRAEREQGITIDVAYRYFSTPKRKFIIADCPGHLQYTRNMITGASTANMLVLLIDARKGLTEQTKRHAFIANLLQIKHLVVCINKMDAVHYNEEVFESIKEVFLEFSSRMAIPDIQFIPISALLGDNVVSQSSQMIWYKGTTLLYLLENCSIASDLNRIDSRFPVQLVMRPQGKQDSELRAYCGRVEDGVFKPGDEIVVLPSGFTSRIKSIQSGKDKIEEAFAPMNVEITLDDQLDISRGDLLAKPNNRPQVSQDIEIMLCWMSLAPLQSGTKFILRHTTAELHCIVNEVRYKVNINTLHKDENDKILQLNEIGRVQLRTTKPLIFDSYAKNKQTGSLILIDEFSFETVGAAMILG
jgi:sulfate adenylyltransferase subunit 1